MFGASEPAMKSDIFQRERISDMRTFIALACLLALANCTRPSAGYSFHDLVWAAGDGLREYESWVAAEDDGFPNKLCLAGISFSASLAETKGRSGSVGLPLAAPAMGLTGMLGYQFISTESETGTISASLEAKYQTPVVLDETQSDEEIENFISRMGDIYTARNIGGLKAGQVHPPEDLPGYRDRQRPAFSQRDDLAAELWRIRQALHTAVLNSPGGMVLEPGPMTFRVGYSLTASQGGQATVRMGAQQTGQFGASSGATEQNEMLLFYVKNRSPDEMTCNKESLQGINFEDLVNTAKTANIPAKAPAPPKP